MYESSQGTWECERVQPLGGDSTVGISQQLVVRQDCFSGKVRSFCLAENHKSQCPQTDTVGSTNRVS